MTSTGWARATKSAWTLLASQIPERCAIYRGNNQVVWVELCALVESGSTLADLRLQRDDVVYVPSILERFVSVLGEVQYPGAIPLTFKSTLASVLAEAGGITDHAGNNPHIQIVDTATGTLRTLTYNDDLDPVKLLEVTLRPGEIVYVPKSGFYRATYVLERFKPLVSVSRWPFTRGYYESVERTIHIPGAAPSGRRRSRAPGLRFLANISVHSCCSVWFAYR